MFVKNHYSCPCGYCGHFKLIEYYKGNCVIQKGVCLKHNLLREICDEICEDFVLASCVHTEKTYPKK